MKMDSTQLTRKVFEYDFCNIDHHKWSGIVYDTSEKLKFGRGNCERRYVWFKSCKRKAF